MATGTVEIVIKAKDETKKALGGIQGSLKTLAGVALKVGAAAAAGIGLVGVGMWALATDAAAFEPVRQAFEELADTAGTSKDALLDALREASQGMITDTELMSKANLAMLLIGEDVATQLPDLLAVAQTAALTTGQDFDFLWDSMIRGVGRMSPRILDNLGITIDLATAYENYADKMGLSVDELTVAEQQQAVMNAVLEVGKDMMDDVGLSAEDLALVKLEQLKTTFANVKDQLGQAFIPILLAVLEPLGDLAEEYGPAVVEWGQEFASWLTDEAIPAVQDFMGTAIEWIGNFMEVWVPRLQEAQTEAETVWAAIQEVIETVTSTIQTVISTMLAAVSAWWDENHELIRATAETIWEAIRSLIEIATTAIQTIIDNTLQTIKAWWDENHELIRATAETIWEAIQTFIETTMNFILNDIIIPIATAIKDFWDEHGETILSIAETVWEAIQTFIDTTINIILGIIKTVMLLIQGDWEGAWEEIKEIANTIWEAMKALIDLAINWVKTTVETVLTALQTLWDTLWDEIKQKADDIWEAIKTAVSTKMGEVKDSIKTKLDEAIEMIIGLSDRFRDAGKAIIDGIKSGVKEKAQAMVDSVVQAIKDALAAAKATLGIGCPDPSPVWAELGVGMGEGMISGFQSMLGDMQRTVTQGVDGLSGAMNISATGATATGAAMGGAAAQSFGPGGGGVTINIGNLYGTDREAARKFGRQIAQDVAMRGVALR